MANVKPTPPHGTSSRYTNQGCRCLECRAAQAAYAKEWRAKNRERIDAVAKAWREANVEARRVARRERYLANRDQILAVNREWSQSNPEKRRAIQARHRANNLELANKRSRESRRRHPEAQIRRRREWTEKNRDLTVLYAANRRAREKAADRRTISRDDIRRLNLRYANRCAYCGAEGKLALDHVAPLIRGGRHAIGNLLPACRSCNSSKGSKLLIEWLASKVC